MTLPVILIIVLAPSIILAGFLYWSVSKSSEMARKREEDIKHKMYELSILKEIGDRIGYSLNLEKIVDIITGSLPQFIEHSVAGYMLVSAEKVLFKAKLETTVSRKFVDDVKNRMMNSLSELLDKKFSKDDIKESIMGSIITDSVKDPVMSFFNIPLVINGAVMGVLTVASTRPGLYKNKEMTLLYKIVGEASDAVARLEDVIKTEQGKLGAMVESMVDGVVMTDNDYRVVVVNPAMKRIIGCDVEETVSMFKFIKRLGKDYDIKSKIEESIFLKKVLIEDAVTVGERIFQILVSPVVGESEDKKEGGFGGVVIFHDITKVKEVEKSREQFISMMVHELRAPLDGIKKMGELLKSDKSIIKDKKIHNEYMHMIYESSSDMLNLVNDLLDTTRIESGRFDVYTKSVDIKKIIQDRLNFFDAYSKSEQIVISFISSKDVSGIVKVDSVRILQVLNNLISNAIKFTGAGGSIIIQILEHKKGNKVEDEAKKFGIKWLLKDKNEKLNNYPDALFVAVTDTGYGISEENISKLFNKFVQFEVSARSGKPGNGLGLVIAKGIVEAHGGILGVNSEEGIGSTFYFTLKL